MLFGLELFWFCWMITVRQGLNVIYRSLWITCHKQVLPIRHIDFVELCDRDLFLFSRLNHRNIVSSSSLFIVYKLYWRYLTMCLFVVKHLYLWQLTSYVHKLQFPVYKSRKGFKPARIFYYGSQIDANLVFFLKSPVFCFPIIRPLFVIISFILILIVFVLPFPNTLFHWCLSFLPKYLKFFFLVIPNCQHFRTSHLIYILPFLSLLTFSHACVLRPWRWPVSQ